MVRVRADGGRLHEAGPLGSGRGTSRRRCRRARTLVGEKPNRVVAPGYMWMSGTSFSAPMVAGAAAQLLARKPYLTPNQVKGALMASARYLPSAGSGRRRRRARRGRRGGESRARRTRTRTSTQFVSNGDVQRRGLGEPRLGRRELDAVELGCLQLGLVELGGVQLGRLQLGRIQLGQPPTGSASNWVASNWRRDQRAE